jgi:hypothetical protein
MRGKKRDNWFRRNVKKLRKLENVRNKNKEPDFSHLFFLNHSLLKKLWVTQLISWTTYWRH